MTKRKRTTDGQESFTFLPTVIKKPPTLFQPELDKQSAKQVLKKLLTCRHPEALKRIAANPALLFIKATANDVATDLEGNTRIIKDCSPLQALFAAGNIVMIKAVFEKQPGEKLAYVDRVPNGRQSVAEQLQEKFPNGLDYPPSNYDFTALTNAIEHDRLILIQTNAASEETEQAFAQFRKDFKPGEVSVGHYFNLNDLLSAAEVYKKNFGSWRPSQLLLFKNNVLDYLQRLIVESDAWALYSECESHKKTQDKGQPPAYWLADFLKKHIAQKQQDWKIVSNDCYRERQTNSNVN